MANNDERTSLLRSGESESRSTSGNFAGANAETNYRNSSGGYTQVRIEETARQQTSVRNITRVSSVERLYPIALSWKGINVSVNVSEKKRICCGGSNAEQATKQVLTDVSGIVQPGSLLAIMGASGAGKSTLLNVLTRRNTKSYTFSGDIRLNGWNVGDGIKNVSAYVQQDDLFISTLSVREQLQFRALLRMDRRMGKVARLARVEEVIVEMGLSNCANSRIGNAGGGKKGISGGERKRLSFASESLTNPPIFFCDEPTSGLDTFMAQNIVHTLQEMAERGRTILCTIHQPSSDLFSLFNKILLLSEGRTVFMGTPDETIEFFDRHEYPCPRNYNPADHFIFTLAIIPGKEAECRRKTQALCDVFASSVEANAMLMETDTLVQNASENKHDLLLEEASAGESRYEASWLTQYRYLFWRSWIGVFRDVILFRVRIMQTCVLGVILGLVYLQLSIDQKGVMNINGAIFLLITNTSFSNMFAVVNRIRNGIVSCGCLLLDKSIAELPVFGVVTIMFTTVTYWMIGLYGSWDAFLIAVGVLLLTANVAVSLGYVISVLCGSVTVALAVAPPILIPFMLFGGLFVNNENIPVYFIWLKALSWFKYANEILMVNQWSNVRNITCHTQPDNATGMPSHQECLYRTGDDVLAYTSFEKDNFVMDILLLVALIVGFRLVSLIILVIKAKRSKE